MPDLSDSVNWSEIDANNNNPAPNGWPEGMMPSGVNDAARADRGAMKRFWNRVNPVQTITPSGLVWTFVTANPAYPTAYVNGEVYCFRPAVAAIGGDQFQVNSLGSKPILKQLQFGFAGMVPLVAHDFRWADAQLLYDSSLGSAGAFVLLNPMLPISGDGAGGVTMPGDLTVNSLNTTGGGVQVSGHVNLRVPVTSPDKTIAYLARTNQAAGFRRLGITGRDLPETYYPLEELWINAATTTVTGTLSATGYHSRSGINGPFQVNAFNIQWNGSQAHLWIDNVDEGPIVTGSAGSVVIGGNVSAGSVTASGDISAGGAITAGSMSASGAITAGTLSVSGNATVAGNLAAADITATNGQLHSNGSNAGVVFQDRANSALSWMWYATGGTARLWNGADRLAIDSGGNLTASNLTASNVVANGALNVTGGGTFGNGVTVNGGLGGGVAIRATAGAIQSDFSGTAFYAPNGNVVCQAITAAGGLTLNGANGISIPNGAFIYSTGAMQLSGEFHTLSNCTVDGYLFVGGAAFPTLAKSGSYITLNAADSDATLHACFLVGSAADPTNYSRNTIHKIDNRTGSFTYAVFNGTTPYCYKPGGGTWGDASDIRLKHSIRDYTAGLEQVARLRPVRYQFNGKGGTSDDGTIFTGLIADEVRDVMPEMVGTLPAKLNPTDDHDTDILTLDATSLIYALVNSVKEIANRVSVLESK